MHRLGPAAESQDTSLQIDGFEGSLHPGRRGADRFIDAFQDAYVFAAAGFLTEECALCGGRSIKAHSSEPADSYNPVIYWRCVEAS